MMGVPTKDGLYQTPGRCVLDYVSVFVPQALEVNVGGAKSTELTNRAPELESIKISMHCPRSSYSPEGE